MSGQEIVQTTFTDATLDVLATRFIITALVEDLAKGLGVEPSAYKVALRRRCTDNAERAELAWSEGEPAMDEEDARTRLVAVIASMLA